MKLYPLFLNLKNRDVLVVGAGAVAARKLKALCAGEAHIHVVAPAARPDIQTLAEQGRIRWSNRTYETTDLAHATLVIAATDQPALQKRIAAECQERKIPVNCVDAPELSDFFTGSLVQRGDLQIAISTNGAAPVLAKMVRQKIESLLGPEYEELVRLMQTLRPQINQLPDPRRSDLWARLADDIFLDQLRREGPEAARAQVQRWIEENASC